MDPSDQDVPHEIEQLQKDIAQASQSGEKVPPGMHAELGYLQYREGQTSAATKQFEAEEHLYPESASFMNRLLSHMNGTSEASS